MSKPVAQAAGGSTVVMQRKGSKEQAVPAGMQQPIAEPVEKMESIMQIDGTLKPKSARTAIISVASASYKVRRSPGSPSQAIPRRGTR